MNFVLFVPFLVCSFGEDSQWAAERGTGRAEQDCNPNHNGHYGHAAGGANSGNNAANSNPHGYSAAPGIRWKRGEKVYTTCCFLSFRMTKSSVYHRMIHLARLLSSLMSHADAITAPVIGRYR